MESKSYIIRIMHLMRFAGRCLTLPISDLRESDFERRDEVAERFRRAEPIVPNRHFLHEKLVPGCYLLSIELAPDSVGTQE